MLDSGYMAKLLMVKKDIVSAFLDMGIIKPEKNKMKPTEKEMQRMEDIMIWAIGNDWKDISPNDWPEKIMQNTNLIVEPSSSIRHTMRCVIELYKRKRIIFTPN